MRLFSRTVGIAITLAITFSQVAYGQWANVGSAGFTVDNVSVDPSMVIIGSTPYFAWRSNTAGNKATIMKYDGTNWVGVGPSAVGVANMSNLSIETDGTDPYIAYRLGSFFGANATVLKFDGTNWVNVGADGFSTGTAENLVMAFDGSTPYVFFSDGDHGSKGTVMKYDGTSWVLVGTAGFTSGVASFTDLAISSSGEPHIVYLDGSAGNKATVMKFDGTNWVTVGSAGFSAGLAVYNMIAFDGDTPYICYTDFTNGQKATVEKFDGTSWATVGAAGFTAGTAFHPHLAFDGSAMHIAFTDGANSSEATVMKYDGTNWVTVGSAGFSAGSASEPDIEFVGSTPYLGFADGANSGKGTVMSFTPPPVIAAATGNWNATGTWDGGAVPTSTDNVEIPSSYTVTVTDDPGSPATCADLTIDAGGQLTVNAGKALTANGNTTNNGTFLIEADATGIGSFLDNGTIAGSGSFQMQQNITGSGGATPDGVFWYVSSPITDATSGVHNAGGTDRMWSADETTQSYPEITTDAASMTVGEGYVVRKGSTATVTYSGSSYNTGSISTSGLPRTGTISNNRGYNLMGNPYPSSVDWETATRTNLQTTIWYRTKNGSTMLIDTYNATTDIGTNNNGGGAVTSQIPPTQAVWVRVDADGNTGTLGFSNSDRSHQGNALLRTASPSDNVRVSLTHNGVSDEHIILFDTDASELKDDYDSDKLFGGVQPYLYSTVENQDVTMNGVNNPTSTPFIDLTYVAPEQGEYTINGVDFTNPGIPVTLEDHELGAFTDLQANPTYIFNSEAGTFFNRFTLHFSELITELAGTNGEEVRIYQNANGINVWLGDENSGSVRIIDMVGRTVYSQNLNSNRVILDHAASAGVYLVEVTTATGTTTKKINL